MRLFRIVCSIIIIVALLLQASAFDIASIWYIALSIGSIVSIISELTSSVHPKVNVPITILLVVSSFSIIVNGAIPLFRPWQRFFGFILLLLTFSSLLPYNRDLKRDMFHCFKLLLFLFILVSFVLGVMGIQLNAGRRDFCGLANHSMMLAPLASVAAILVFDDIFKKRGFVAINWTLFLLFISTVFLAASRIAIAGLVVSLFSYFFAAKDVKSFWKYLIAFFLLATIIFIVNPYGMADNFINKMSNRDINDLDSLTSDRWTMIQDRIREFKESPIFGVGFAQMKYLKLSKVDIFSGVTESGSSWIYLLSSIGLLGLLSFLIILINSLKATYMDNKNSVVFAIIVFFIVHMSVEGYLFAVGSSLSAIFWFFIGLAQFSESDLA